MSGIRDLQAQNVRLHWRELWRSVQAVGRELMWIGLQDDGSRPAILKISDGFGDRLVNVLRWIGKVDHPFRCVEASGDMAIAEGGMRGVGRLQKQPMCGKSVSGYNLAAQQPF